MHIIRIKSPSGLYRWEKMTFLFLSFNILAFFSRKHEFKIRGTTFLEKSFPVFVKTEFDENFTKLYSYSHVVFIYGNLVLIYNVACFTKYRAIW